MGTSWLGDKNSNDSKSLLRQLADYLYSNAFALVSDLVGYVKADGSVPFTGQQAFNAGLKTDSIAEKTLGAGITLSSFLQETSSDALTAAGTNQGTSLALISAINNVTTVAASTGVILPAGAIGRYVFITNNGANTLNVYPATGSKIDGGSVNAAIIMQVGEERMFYMPAISAGWYSGKFLGSQWAINSTGQFFPITDNTYDIGTGALNPRDIHIGRNVFALTLLPKDGTVSQPSISFENEGNSGLYRVGSNDIGIAINGVKKIDIDIFGLHASNVFIPTGGELLTDTIIEYTTDVGVTIEGSLLKDSNIAAGQDLQSTRDVIVGRSIILTTDAGISAAGTNQGTATAVDAAICNVTTVASGTGVKFNATDTISIVYNNGANTLSVYPASGGTIDGGSANVAITMAVGEKRLFWNIGQAWTSYLFASNAGIFAPAINATAKTTSYTLVASTDYAILTDSSGGAFAITAPVSATIKKGQIFTITDSTGSAGAANVTFTPGAGQTIVGNTTKLTNNYQSLTIQWDGTSKWYVK